MVNDRGNRGSVRIHVIVLTKDRPETLRRCIATALPSLGPHDTLTILDDSLAERSPARIAIATINSSVAGPTRVHLSMSRASDAISGSLADAYSLWLSKSAPRDIAPLRNLALLLTAAVPAHTTILIDDDIHSFDLVATHDQVINLACASPGVILGAEMRGISELDLITRLTDAIDTLEEPPPGISINSVRDLFRVRASANVGNGNGCESQYVSGGYLAFRIPAQRLFAFPPGYNEDWLWCLLYGKDPQMRVARSHHSVVHDPPVMRRPTREDVLLELVGDLVFDCLEGRQRRTEYDPRVALTGLARGTPSLDSMPSARAAELLEKTRSFRRDHSSLSALDDYGLRVLGDMLQTGELHIDGKRVLSSWSSDAIAKRRAFAASLHDENTVSIVKRLFQEGRIS